MRGYWVGYWVEEERQKKRRVEGDVRGYWVEEERQKKKSRGGRVRVLG